MDKQDQEGEHHLSYGCCSHSLLFSHTGNSISAVPIQLGRWGSLFFLGRCLYSTLLLSQSAPIFRWLMVWWSWKAPLFLSRNTLGLLKRPWRWQPLWWWPASAGRSPSSAHTPDCAQAIVCLCLVSLLGAAPGQSRSSTPEAYFHLSVALLPSDSCGLYSTAVHSSATSYLQLQTEKLPQKCEQLLPFVLNLAEVGLSLPSSEQPQLDCPL